ncbi:MAG TPA: hypothetical protein VL401_03200 [Alphaproteobacteria bacterium]|jgi:hypothetical protein|nr:hypothetical protein [Alphaproteobacteria bacterium]
MKLAQNIKPKTGIWKLLPKIFSKNTAHALYPNIYLPEKIYLNLLSKNPNVNWIGVLKHEQTHITRQRQLGPMKWNLKYIFSKKFRLDEEIIANTIQIQYCQKHKIKFDIERKARFLASWVYGWPDSYQNIKSKFESVKMPST